MATARFLHTVTRPTIVRIALLALSYYLLARLGLLLAIPPGYATALWPPSGLALAALLIGGYRLAGGVFLGSFAANIFVSQSLSGRSLSGLDYALPASIALSATLQAALARFLVNRVYRDNWNFLQLRQALAVIVLGGPVACITAATISSLSLYLAGQISTAGFTHTWMTWWMGDSLGVLIFTPLLLLAWQPSASVRPTRKLAVALPVFGLFLFVGYLYASVKADVERHLDATVSAEAQLVSSLLDEVIKKHIMILRGTAGLFHASQLVEREEFLAYHTAFGGELPPLHILAWAPRVARGDIERFVASARRQGYRNYQITETNGGAMLPTGNRPVYQPLLHIAPLAENHRALGFDLLSEPTRRRTIEAALASGALAVGGPVDLVRSDQLDQAYLLVLPVNIDAGVVISVLWVEHLTEPLAELRNLKGRITLTDSATGISLYGDSSGAAGSPRFRHQGSIEFANSRWQLDVALPKALVGATMNERLWPIVTGGFGVIGSLALLIISTTGAQARSRAMVTEKTTELEEERAFLNAIIENMPTVLYVKDAQTRQYLRLNKTAYAMFDQKPGSYEGRTQDELFAGAMGVSSRPVDDRVVFEGEVVDEVTHFSRDGTTYWFKSKKVPIRNSATGEVKYILGLAEDITATRDAEHQLAESRKRLAQILESVGDGIFGTDQAGRCNFINPAALGMLGYTESEVLGTSVHALLHHHYPDGRVFPQEECPVYRSMLTGKSYRVDDQVFWKKDDTAIPVEYFSSPLIADGAVIGAVVVFSDISKRQVLERLQQEHTRRLEQINQELEEFSYVASHDIQEPLRTLNCFCDFLVEDLGEAITEKAAMDVHYIQEASQRMHVLINDMLEYSRAGRAELSVDAVNLGDSLTRIQNDLLILISEAKAALKVGPLPMVLGDRQELGRVFQNLVQNAIKFARDDTPPVIEVFEAARDTDTVTIAVRDNGIGIEAQFIEQIFGAFRRLHESERFPGSGIGLAVVKKLVERQGGSVRVESVPGQGSVFYVTLRQVTPDNERLLRSLNR